MNMQKIRKWFYDHYSAPHRQIIKFTWKWSARNAFYHDKKTDVMELAQEMSGGAPGSQAFLGALQDATTRLWKKLSIEEECYVTAGTFTRRGLSRLPYDKTQIQGI
jgi:hypothetical protein